MAIGESTKYGKILAEWQVPEYIKYKHFFGWYIGMILLGVVLFIQAIITLNILFAVIIILIAVIITLHELRHPSMIDFLIVEDGVILGEKFYPYKDLNTFWIIYQPPQVRLLYFGIKKTLRAELPIHLEDQNPVNIRGILLNYLPEDIEKEEEAIDERLSRLLRI